MKNSYLNLRASYSSIQKPKKAPTDPKDMRLTDYYATNKLSTSIDNPNSTRHQSALRKMAELYTGSGVPDYDVSHLLPRYTPRVPASITPPGATLVTPLTRPLSTTPPLTISAPSGN